MKTTASAPGKIILFGEHAVVYGQPAIALPVPQLRATATVADADSAESTLHLPDIDQTIDLAQPSAEPLVAACEQVRLALGLEKLPPLDIELRSDIPIASGLGSGAATAAALIRALLTHLGSDPSPERINELTYAIETIHHGTPSGIDNTVVSYEEPVYFVRTEDGPQIERIEVGVCHFLIGDTGQRASTKAVVGGVRERRDADPRRYDGLFSKIGRLVHQARSTLKTGTPNQIGALMTLNQIQLRGMKVSNRALDDLIDRALWAGAHGAKLSGAGGGGNMIALVDEKSAESVRDALLEVGATRVLEMKLG